MGDFVYGLLMIGFFVGCAAYVKALLKI